MNLYESRMCCTIPAAFLQPCLPSTWAQLLTALTAVAFVIGALAVGWVTFKIRSEDSWRKTAEGRKARLDDAETNCQKLMRELTEVTDERDRINRSYWRTQAKVDWYESRHGPIPPNENLSR